MSLGGVVVAGGGCGGGDAAAAAGGRGWAGGACAAPQAALSGPQRAGPSGWNRFEATGAIIILIQTYLRPQTGGR